MLTEKQFEDILCKYPSLIEDGLYLKGRQMRVAGKIIDILFQDRHKQRLIVEVKIGPIVRDHVGQIMDYLGELLSQDEPNIRVMLVGNRVPIPFRKSLDHLGIEWKEITFSALSEFLHQNGDESSLGLLEGENLRNTTNGENQNLESLSSRHREPKKERTDVSVQSFLNLVEDSRVLVQINELRNRILSLGRGIIEYARIGPWIEYKANRNFCGINIYPHHFIVCIQIPRKDVTAQSLDIANLKDVHYIKIRVHQDTNMDTIFELIGRAYGKVGTSAVLPPERKMAALFVPLQEIWFRSAFEYFKSGNGILCYGADSSSKQVAIFPIKNIYFKKKGENVISAKADLIDISDQPTLSERLNKNENDGTRYKFYYRFKNLRLLDNPVKLTELKNFNTQNYLQNSVQGTSVIFDPEVD